jgi:hypothetical protein
MSELRRRMIRDMTVRGFSPRTHEAYIRAVVVGLAKHYRRSPDQLTHDEVQAHLAHLHQHRKLAWSSCSQAAHAFRFLCHVTLGHERAQFQVPAPRQPQTLPEILSREEVWRLFNACPRVRDRLLLATTDAAGLRVSEVVHLKVSDLDVDRMTVRIEQGKGARDRYVPLSPRLLKEWRLGHGEGEQEVLAGQLARSLPLQPLMALPLLAARTVPVTAGAMDDVPLPAPVAHIQGRPCGLGMAIGNRGDDVLVGLGHGRSEPVEVGRPVRAKEFLETRRSQMPRVPFFSKLGERSVKDMRPVIVPQGASLTAGGEAPVAHPIEGPP